MPGKNVDPVDPKAEDGPIFTDLENHSGPIPGLPAPVFNNNLLNNLHQSLADLRDTAPAESQDDPMFNVLDDIALILAELDARAGIAVGLESRVQAVENR
jgi:hypothetical protein